MKKLGFNGLEESKIGASVDKSGGDINVQLIKSLFKEKILWKEKIDGLLLEIKKKPWKKLFKNLKKNKMKLF